MSEDTPVIQEMKKEIASECRTCLRLINTDEDPCYIFQRWVPPWEGVEDTVAEALQRIAQIQLSDMDPHSKVICEACCEKLHSACIFANLAQQSDCTLWQRCPPSDSLDKRWPKPIQIDKNIPLDEQREIKQEELSDEEYSEYCGVDTAQDDEAGMEIKIEPVELIPRQEIPVEMNGHCDGTTPDGLTPEVSLNGDEIQEHYNIMVKEEPVSDSESAGTTDMSLDCMLCTKVFNSVSGLKAHVIAQHSYKSVRRKAANETSPVKRQKHEHVCATCRRSFATTTDLMVHETCHNKSVCYGCNEKFDSFELVMQHRLICKAINNKEHGPVKTLEDVQRGHDKRRKRQQRYRERNREILKQREAMRRKRKQYLQSIVGASTSSNTNSIELNNEDIWAGSEEWTGLEETNSHFKKTQRSSSANSENSEESAKELLKCTLCEETFTDNYYMNIHLEIHHPTSSGVVNEDDEMEVEALESLFSERA